MQKAETENIDIVERKMKRIMLALSVVAIGSIIAIFVYLSFVS